MLSISELGRFYYLRNFHDMKCKYGRVLSVIRQQMDRNRWWTRPKPCFRRWYVYSCQSTKI